MNERQARDKERYQSKEREEVVKKAREMKAAELKVRGGGVCVGMEGCRDEVRELCREWVREMFRGVVMEV